MFIHEEDSPEDVFRNYVCDRAAYLLDITKKEAEVLMDVEDDNEVNICDGCASIRYGDYNDFLRLSDAPEPPADKDGMAGEKDHTRENDGQ